MAESYTVQAVLSAKDQMSSTFKSAAGATESFGSKLKSAIGLGSAMQIGMSAVNATMNTLKSHMSDAISRYDQLNQFPKTMNNLGISSSAASAALDELDKGITGLPTTLNEATQGVTRFVSKNSDIKKSTKYFIAMNNAILAGGASTNDQSAAVEQLSQAYSKGTMDMQEWRSIQTAMPAQLNQIAKAMGTTSDALGEGLRDGTISMDEFMDTMVELNETGVDGLASFAEQAQDATGGIATSMINMGSAITRGITDCISAIDKLLSDNELPTIAEMFQKARVKIDEAFSGIQSAISQLNIEGIIWGLTPAFETLQMAAGAAGSVIKAVAGFLNEHAAAVSSLIPVLIAGVAAFKAYKKISIWMTPLSGVTKKVEELDQATGKSGKRVNKLKNALASFTKMAGVALIVASLALLVKTMTGLASLGTTAVAPLATFGVVVAGLAAVFAGLGKKLETSATGIIVFAAAVSAMAIAMAPLAQTGTEGAIAMAAFGVVVAGLAVVFATFGTALDAASIGILALGASVLLIGEGMKLATPFVTAITGLIKQMGDTVSQVAGAISSAVSTILGAFGSLVSVVAGAVSKVVSVVGGTLCSVMTTAGNTISRVTDSISDGFLKISDGVATVIEAISGGFSSVLDSIAGIIESIGTSARNAGAGFQSVAEGIKTIAGMSLWDIGKSLAAVATGIGTISTNGANLPQVATSMQMLITAISLGAGSLTAFNAAMLTMLSSTNNAATGVNNLKAAFSNFTIKAPNTGAFTSAITAVAARARQLKTELTSAGRQAGTGFSSGLKSGMANALTAVKSSANSIIASIKTLPAKFSTVGKNSGTKLASSLQSGLRKSVTISKQAVTSINTALNAGKSKAYSAGRNIGTGLANGMRSTLGTVRSVAAQLAAAAEKAIKAKAKIASPSKVTTKLGEYFGEGWVSGMEDKISDAKSAAAEFVSIASGNAASLAYAGSGYSSSISDSYSYSDSVQFTVEVPVNLDGKEVASVTAPYTETELDKRSKRASRKKGER